jgi:hypothetical protein
MSIWRAKNEPCLIDRRGCWMSPVYGNCAILAADVTEIIRNIRNGIKCAAVNF